MTASRLTNKHLRKISVVLCTAILSIIILSAAVTPSYGAEGKEADTKVYMPILMYHHFVKEIPRNGDSGATVTADKFRGDMKFLQENGYTALLPQDLKAVTEGTMDMPEKPIMITLDDGYESAYTIAYPILEETGMKATVFAIVSGVDKPKKKEIKKLNWEQMKEMYESGIFDIQSHSYDLHNSTKDGAFKVNQINGIERKLVECKAQYELRVGTDIAKSVQLIEENVGTDVICFSYPYGADDEWGREVLKNNGILFGFSTVYGLARLNEDLGFLGRFSVGMSTDLDLLLED